MVFHGVQKKLPQLAYCFKTERKSQHCEIFVNRASDPHLYFFHVSAMNERQSNEKDAVKKC
jgi:hypothetical protein